MRVEYVASVTHLTETTYRSLHSEPLDQGLTPLSPSRNDSMSHQQFELELTKSLVERQAVFSPFRS